MLKLVRNPIWFGLFILASAAAAWFVIDRVIFLQSAKRTEGVVNQVIARNSRCSKSCGRRCTRHYDCTKFTAHVGFTSEAGESGLLEVGAGQRSGHGVSIVSAAYRQGQSIPVVYNPRNLKECYQDSLGGVWGTTLMALFGQCVSLIAALAPPRRRTQTLA